MYKMPKRQSGFISNNIAVSSKFDEVEYSKIMEVHDNLNTIEKLLGTLDAVYYGALDTEPVDGETNPSTGNPYELENGNLYYNTIDKVLKVHNGTNWDTIALKFYVDTQLLNKTDIVYGAGVPDENVTPTSGTNTIYVDTNTSTSYICNSVSPVNWIINGSGQFADIGDSRGKSVPYVVSTTAANETITIKSGTNGFAIDSFTAGEGSELIVEDGAVFKVL